MPPDAQEPEGFLPQGGNYQDLLSYRKSEIIYDFTFRFCERFLKRGDRTIDQMVQSARSGKQNIAEGSRDKLIGRIQERYGCARDEAECGRLAATRRANKGEQFAGRQREPPRSQLVGEAMTAKAVAGDFSQRIELQGKSGFFLQLSKGTNEFAARRMNASIHQALAGRALDSLA